MERGKVRGNGEGWAWRDKALLWVSLLGAGTFVLLAFWLQNAILLPPLNVPTPVMPSPNAHDIYLQAARLKTGSGGAILGNQGSKLTLAQKEKLVSADAPALNTVRKGFVCEYRAPIVRSYNSFFSYGADFRELARSLAAEGMVWREKGDLKRAAGPFLDAQEFGIHVSNGVLINLLVGIAMEAIGSKPLWEIADQLPADTARRAALRLEAIEERRVPLADILEEEMWSSTAALHELLQKSGPFEIGKGLSGGGSNASNALLPPLEELAIGWAVISKGKRQIFEDYSRFYQKHVEVARQPYQANLPPITVPDDPLNQALAFDSISNVLVKYRNSRMQNALLRTTLALRAWNLEKGDYPASLQELVREEYLTREPLDPFTEKRPLPYRRLPGGKYLLYSVGADGADNSGKPVAIQRLGNRKVSWAEKGQSGDFVAGINTYP